jgi:hypothetical protein
MIYICIEDETSGYDFISTIIKRVIKPATGTYTILTSLRGCENFKKLFNRSKVTNLLYLQVNDMRIRLYKGDTVVLFKDDATRSDNNYISALMTYSKFFGVNIYIADLYCFEQVLFSYPIFETYIYGLSNYTSLYSDFKRVLRAEVRGYDNFYAKYATLLKKSGTVESMANRIFCLYFSNMPCVRVNKHQYTSLDAYLNEFNAFTNKRVCTFSVYYNNLCMQASLSRYCDNRYNSKNCFIRDIQGFKNTNKLRHFYLYSDLAKPLLNVRNQQEVKTLHEILGGYCMLTLTNKRDEANLIIYPEDVFCNLKMKDIPNIDELLEPFGIIPVISKQDRPPEEFLLNLPVSTPFGWTSLDKMATDIMVYILANYTKAVNKKMQFLSGSFGESVGKLLVVATYDVDLISVYLQDNGIAIPFDLIERVNLDGIQYSDIYWL